MKTLSHRFHKEHNIYIPVHIIIVQYLYEMCFQAFPFLPNNKIRLLMFYSLNKREKKKTINFYTNFITLFLYSLFFLLLIACFYCFPSSSPAFFYEYLFVSGDFHLLKSKIYFRNYACILLLKVKQIIVTIIKLMSDIVCL